MKDYIARKIKWFKENYKPEEYDTFKAYIIEHLEKIDDEEFAIKSLKEITKLKESNKINKPKQEKEDQGIICVAKKVETLVKEKSVALDTKYKDKNDNNQFNWGGLRSTNRLFEHPMHTAPMFFRRNGLPVNIVNLYQGRSVFLINNGPSFKEVDHSKLKRPGILTYGINNGAHVFRPNLWTCVDDPTRFLKSIWSDPTIMKIIPQSHLEKPIWENEKDDFSKEVTGEFPNVIGFRRNEHFDADSWLFEDTINWGNHKDYGGGRSVMIACLRICFLLGFKNVYLLGCDFEMDEDKKYFFDEQRTKGSINNNNSSYEKMVGYFTQLKPKFEEVGFNVYNLNPNSNLKVFNFSDFDACIEKETINTSDSTYGMYVDPKKRKK